jgi:iron(III) transport system ATP-binding protein
VVLRFENVSKAYAGVNIVDDLSLSLRRGEILTLLGASGCGKTTTLRMAIGLERCSAGRIFDSNRLIDAPAEHIFAPPERRNMGMVFQSYAVWPHMTVFENVAFPLRARRAPRHLIDERVSAALAMTGLGELAGRAGNRLSGGQQQRVAVARSLAFNPDVLLMDEPFSNLDANRRDQLRVEIRALQRQLGISILFVTHDQAEALAISDRLAIMANGRLEQLGTPREVYAEPATAFVRDFLGPWIKFAGVLLARSPGEATVRLREGSTLVAGGADNAGAGEVMLAIRPEQVRIEPATRPPHGNQLAARLTSLQFLGRAYAARAELTNGESFAIELPAAGEWASGQAVVLTLPEPAISLWPRASA